MIWGHKINLKKHGKQLNRLNRIASTSATAIERTTPQASLEMLTNILPLDLHIKEVGMNSYVRLKSQLDKPSTKIKTFNITHLQYWDNLTKNIDYMDDRCNHVIWEKHLKIDKASLLGRKSKYLDSEITIYTDGSKIGGKVGSGFVVFKRKKVIFFQNARLPDKATVFQAELYAIFLAGRYIQTMQNEQYKYIKIYSDSQAAILALDKNEIYSQLVLDTIQVWELVLP